MALHALVRPLKRKNTKKKIPEVNCNNGRGNTGVAFNRVGTIDVEVTDHVQFCMDVTVNT